MVGVNVGNLNMDELGRRVADLEYDQKRNGENIQECTKAVKDMADAVNRFVVHAEVSKIKEEGQIKFNDEVKGDIKEIKQCLSDINNKRAEEKQARSFLMKSWPFLATLVGSVSLVKLAEFLAKH